MKSAKQEEQTERSALVFAAKRAVPDRYTLCRVLSTATRRFHRPNSRIEETTDTVLRHLANSVTAGQVAVVDAGASVHE